ncbi:halocyanin domain-containing protein [Halogranum amylolyticum]|uniref:Halocyanin domain-containing protein n=1 Tax=Halogranum amylolyticum TaxID=660520 RepID=A0A1H8USQ2_9EURY|nr:halocyanin domain-containing protein [Halogranum amylolyticum]
MSSTTRERDATSAVRDPDVTRRTVSRGAVSATTACLALGSAGGTAAQSSGESDLAGWFGNVDNYEGVVDETGNAEVTITVGTSANGGNFGFGPAAVRVDPGTTVVWEWSGKGGTHNVVAEDGSFESEMTGEAGHTFEQTLESTGVRKYACVPHQAMGMKGAVVVGDPQSTDEDDGLATTLTLSGGVGLVGGLVALFGFGTREKAKRRGPRPDL